MPPHDHNHLDGADIRGFYTALGIHLPDWATVETSVRCFADPDAHRRGDRKPSCSVNLASGLWNCHGCSAAGNPFLAAVRLGHNEQSANELLIRFGLAEGRPARLRHRDRSALSAPTQGPRAPVFEVSEGDVARWRTDLILQPLILQRLARERGWNVSTIRAFELGIDGERITIPVRDERRRLVGLLRYRPWGPGRGGPKMLAAPGSRRQLLPHPSSEPTRQLLLVEGEPDMLAARSQGLPAIALPGVESWKPEWASIFAKRRVDIVMDADRPGRAMADQIARDLAVTADARIVEIAPDRADGYDLTDWLVNEHQANTSPYDALVASVHQPEGENDETYD